MRFSFTSLREFFSGKAPQQQENLGLSEQDLQLLRAFRASPEWDAFLNLLDAHCKLYSEQLLKPLSRDASALHETRGVIIGLREAAFLVDKTLHAANERDSATRKRSESAANAVDPRSSALYATPFWS